MMDEAYLPEDVWDSAVLTEGIDPEAPIAIGIDPALDGSTAVVIAQLLPDGRMRIL